MREYDVWVLHVDVVPKGKLISESGEGSCLCNRGGGCGDRFLDSWQVQNRPMCRGQSLALGRGRVTVTSRLVCGSHPG